MEPDITRRLGMMAGGCDVRVWGGRGGRRHLLARQCWLITLSDRKIDYLAWARSPPTQGLRQHEWFKGLDWSVAMAWAQEMPFVPTVCPLFWLWMPCLPRLAHHPPAPPHSAGLDVAEIPSPFAPVLTYITHATPTHSWRRRTTSVTSRSRRATSSPASSCSRCVLCYCRKQQRASCVSAPLGHPRVLPALPCPAYMAAWGVKEAAPASAGAAH
jgi:hypothetical protein